MFSEATIESEVFAKFCAVLRITVDPNDIADALCGKHVITDSELAEVKNPRLMLLQPPNERMDNLLSAVRRAILMNAENFYIFLDVLANADKKYVDLVTKMKDSLPVQGR